MTSNHLARFSGRLLRGERIRWAAQPGQGLLFQPRDALLIPFSLLWGGFAFFWEFNVLRSNAPGAMALFGIPFVIVGLYVMIGRFALDAWLRKRTYYALTDQRLLILREAPWSSFTAVQLDRLPDATVTESARGRGTIRFGGSLSLLNANAAGFGAWTPILDPTPQLLAIENVRDVFAAVQQRSQPASGQPVASS